MGSPLSIVSSQPDAPPATRPTASPLRIVSSQPDAGPVSRAASSFWQTVNPASQYAALGNSLYNLVTHPINTLTQVGKDNDAPRVAAKEAFDRGDYTEGVRHSVNWLLNAIPGLGSQMEKASDQAQAGDVAGGIGTTLGVGTNLALASKSPAIIEAAPRVAKAAGSGVVAAAPKVAGGAAMIGAGEVLGKVPGMEWPARIGLGYPGVRKVFQGLKDGVEAAKSSWSGAEASGVPVASPEAAASADTEMLDKIAQGQGYSSYAKMPDSGKATVDALYQRMTSAGDATSTSTPSAPSAPVAKEPGWWLTPEEKAATAAPQTQTPPKTQATPQAPSSPPPGVGVTQGGYAAGPQIHFTVPSDALTRNPKALAAAQALADALRQSSQ
jgi:hypothetical protein